ncbi:hypothetical protein RJ639_037444 [Escallonia herrerae]|uniref:Wound-responsive family protein n=1 Tax=Escallonia herrerae TaxID=1293975 RepID=A0AA88X4I2_9ASTE|nr:hypothetical protein RJ639_037444 [Escallonia herrerae]
MASSTSRAWVVAASLGTVEALKDQMGFCRWNYNIRSMHQNAKNKASLFSQQTKKYSSSSSPRLSAVVSSCKDGEEKAKHAEDSLRKVIMIHPVPSEDAWVVSGLDALALPFYRKPTGRPKKVRRKGDDEARNPSTVGRSNNCLFKSGHVLSELADEVGQIPAA